jgi:hypothetical protein
MIPLTSLWLPILVSSVIVWLAAAIAWMVLPHHRSDVRPLKSQNDLIALLQRDSLTPGQYYFPEMVRGATAEEMAARAKLPSGFLTVRGEDRGMSGTLVKYFLWLVAANILIAYVAAVALKPDTHYLTVFRVVGTTAILAYTAAQIPNSIWWGRPWSATIKDLIDGAVFGLLTAGTFGWLWP